jgi:FMN phosphatase YigB (HAD superfamily)
MRAKEFNQPKRSLVIFDIDDTLLHTTAKIRVVKDGHVVRELTNQQFNNYQLQPGEDFDFGEFRSAEKFNRESQPIKPMINKLNTILNHAGNAEVIMLTARADFDNKDLFLKTFKDLGIDMSRVHVHRAGNLPGDEIPAEKKAVYVRRYADTRRYDHIRLYDDSKSNLSVFKELKNEYPNIDFRAYYVGPTGGTNVFEHIENIKHHKQNFLDMFEKFLPLAMKYIGLTSLPKIKFEAHIHDDVQPTFGKYENGEHVLYVALMNRHPNDILRTLAHELTHYRQDTEHELEHDSGKTGSPHENQANAIAGIVMRHFNKLYPEYLSSKPITG